MYFNAIVLPQLFNMNADYRFQFPKIVALQFYMESSYGPNRT